MIVVVLCAHVHLRRPQPQLPARHSPPRRLARRQQNPPAHLGQPFLLAPEKIETFRRLLRDETLVSPHDLLSTRKTLPHGHVEALLLAVRKLGLDTLLSSQPCRERDF